jgi:hypothetical protein
MSQQQIQNRNLGHTFAPRIYLSEDRTNIGGGAITATHLSQDRATLGAEQLRPHTCHRTGPLLERSNYGHTIAVCVSTAVCVEENVRRPNTACVADAIGPFSATKAFQKRRKIKKVLGSLGAGFNEVTLPWPHRQKIKKP